MTYESSNRIFGEVKNPWNKNKTAGGSTGGEASLLASRSSPIGIGSDIGGSLRNPAEFCGICSLKPNSSRFMTSGHF
jgi:Asp-tRNA(Asn)/Glu-tRNA(Gln) amidotransferase A subunit family amidase